MVLRGTLGWSAAGVGIGLLTSLAAGRVLGAYLFGIEFWDPLTFLGVPLLLGITSLGAAAIPARRAAEIEPMRALEGG
jgi:ABC-type antimicrobial peptide transport system permease subunit